jgi:antitoxin HicB
MKHPKYRCTYELDDNGTLLVRCPAFPEVITYGDGLDDAARRALDAIEEAIAARISDGRAIPPSGSGGRTPGKADFWVRLPQLTAEKVMLYSLLSEVGVTRAELARQLHWHREQVDRLFRLDHASKADQMESAFRALGHEVDVTIRKAG